MGSGQNNCADLGLYNHIPTQTLDDFSPCKYFIILPVIFRLIERCCMICEHSEYEDFEEYF